MSTARILDLLKLDISPKLLLHALRHWPLRPKAQLVNLGTLGELGKSSM